MVSAVVQAEAAGQAGDGKFCIKILISDTIIPIDAKSEGGFPMDKWVCTVCGYIYDETVGDPDHGIAAGTKFEDIPEDWVCPVCGVGKDQFEKQ